MHRSSANRLQALKQTLALMTDLQEWWLADFGHYGPLFHPDGMRQRRHLPHWRRPRRGRDRARSIGLRRSTVGRTTNLDKVRCRRPIKQNTATNFLGLDPVDSQGNWVLESRLRIFGWRAGAKMSGNRKRTSTGAGKDSGL